MIGKYPVMTFSGSTRFKEQSLEARKYLIHAGNIIISVEGTGRFVIGFAADIKILQGKKLLDYIRKYDKKWVQMFKLIILRKCKINYSLS